ncbi:MAG: RNA polymerase factor sigma-54 [Gammaproteobacteria bacterium]|nr:RNA polymerase factor sigma-54 [Gammaproteobacteria bacterium]
MKQSIQLRLGQHLTMTPQLQQAIRLLQLSSLELQHEIQEALDSNMMLELNEEEGESGDSEYRSESEPEDSRREEQATGQDVESETASDQQNNSSDETIPDDLPVDTSWDDIYEASPTLGPASGEERDYDYQGSTEESLAEHLNWQLEMSHISVRDRLIAESIIDAIDEDGYLTVSLEDILTSLQDSEPQEEFELDELEAVLRQIQNFDPLGVGARDLHETLLIQIRQLPPDTPWLAQAAQLLNNHFELLAKRDYNQLARRMKLDDESLKSVIQLIQTLNPRPGNQISSNTTEYVVPDVFVRKVAGHWRVELNPDTAPRLRINPYYASLVQRGNSSSDNVSLKNHLQEARWFLKSLQSRNETLLKVATSIVERQRDFFERGEEAMKPLVLHDIAEAVGMHESTISRVTNKKYLHSPLGIFELKYFFSSHVKSDEGDDYSSTAIHALIKKLIADEDPRKPLSDSKIVDLLAEQGVNVARRTIAKYREALNIPPSNQRKRLA